MDNTANMALLMIQEIRDALARGTRHYSAVDNRPLLTDLEIVSALRDEGKIVFEPLRTTNIG